MKFYKDYDMRKNKDIFADERLPKTCKTYVVIFNKEQIFDKINVTNKTQNEIQALVHELVKSHDNKDKIAKIISFQEISGINDSDFINFSLAKEYGYYHFIYMDALNKLKNLQGIVT
jgi:hypothetical protein